METNGLVDGEPADDAGDIHDVGRVLVVLCRFVRHRQGKPIHVHDQVVRPGVLADIGALARADVAGDDVDQMNPRRRCSAIVFAP